MVRANLSVPFLLRLVLFLILVASRFHCENMELLVNPEANPVDMPDKQGGFMNDDVKRGMEMVAGPRLP